MFFPVQIHTLDNRPNANETKDLLELNIELKKHGLALTPAEAEEIITARSRTLQNQGRIELDMNVSKLLINRLSLSTYVIQDNYVDTITEMYEVFHVIKNACSDFVSDEEVIDAMMIYYEKVCGGSTEFLMGKGIEKILSNYNHHRSLSVIIREEEGAY